jgi:hypothetical protein
LRNRIVFTSAFRLHQGKRYRVEAEDESAHAVDKKRTAFLRGPETGSTIASRPIFFFNSFFESTMNRRKIGLKKDLADDQTKTILGSIESMVTVGDCLWKIHSSKIE